MLSIVRPPVQGSRKSHDFGYEIRGIFGVTMLVSIFNDVIGPVMRGPSSSHCAAALRIGRLAHAAAGLSVVTGAKARRSRRRRHVATGPSGGDQGPWAGAAARRRGSIAVNMRLWTCRLLLALGWIAAAAVVAEEPVVLLVPDRVFDGEAAHAGWSVLVRGERIAAAGPAATVAAPDGARTIRRAGQTLIPGLIDGHSHLLLHPYDETSWNDQVAREPLALTSAHAKEKPVRERSAAVIWEELDRAGCAHEVVLWNAFPWHPYGETVTSNRKPRLTEVAQGCGVLAAAAIGVAPFEGGQHRLWLEGQSPAEGLDRIKGLVGRQGSVADGDQPPKLTLAARVHPDEHGRHDNSPDRDAQDDRTLHAASDGTSG